MIGQSIGHYEITAKLGQGGMGEVYRARDTRLNRDVAIKVLPQMFASDEQRMGRFEREAQVLASLNHPNIASIYGIEGAPGPESRVPSPSLHPPHPISTSTKCLVLELVEGETLQEQIAHGPIAVEEALKIALQICDGLETAHEKGIIHRDLKPANIKLTPEGKVKILDFGLAKALEDPVPDPESRVPGVSQSPTLTMAATQAGIILGTAAYMSPEQAKGLRVDRRSDIWSFGVILFELLTGRPLFQGETVTEILAQVITAEPNWEELPRETPPWLRLLIKRCLTRDQRRRLRDIGEARLAIENPEAMVAEAALDSPKSAAPIWVLGALAAVLFASVVLYWMFSLPEPEGSMYVSLLTPPSDLLHVEGAEGPMAISRDGIMIAYSGRRDGRPGLFLRRLDDPEIKQLVEGTDPVKPFFSPDGRWVGFTSGSSLMKVDLEGNEPIKICDATWGGGSWGRDGNIVFTKSYQEGISIVSADGLNERRLTEPDGSSGELGHWWPQILPDGEHVLFTRFRTPIDEARIALLSLKTGEISNVWEGGTFARYSPSGHLIFFRSEGMMAVRFDLANFQVVGTPVRIQSDIPINLQDGQPFAAFSENGTFVYSPTMLSQIPKSLVWVTRDGQEELLDLPQRPYYCPSLSADGNRAVVPIPDEAAGGTAIDLWLLDLTRGSSTRLTFGPAGNFGAIWGPDDESLFFMKEDPYFEIHRLDPTGNSGPQPVIQGPVDKYPNDLSPDGTYLVYTEWHGDRGNDLWLLPLDGRSEPRPFRETPFHERYARVSPRGDWIAYTSNESGQYEVCIEAFPDGGSRFQVSVDGGDAVEWSPDGSELFYLSGNRMMAVEVQTEPAFSAGKPSLLFEADYDRSFEASGIQVGPDGRFLMMKTPEALQPRELRFILNWFTALERLAPL